MVGLQRYLAAAGRLGCIYPAQFADFRPALVERPFEDAASWPRLRWRPDARWAVCLSLMLLIAILRMRELSPFIYFQF